MIWMVLLVALAATGLILLGWLIAALVLLPIRGSGLRMIICAAGDATRLEQQCRGYLLLWNIGALKLPLVIVDTGLSPEGRELALQLTQSFSQLRLVRAEEVPKLMKTETEELAGK